MMKIDNQLAVPQVIFEEILAINYNQFRILSELNLLQKIYSQTICCHMRFFLDSLAYPKLFSFNQNQKENSYFLSFPEVKTNDCLYCYSNKKCKKKVSILCNFRDSFDHESNQILEYCEQNGVIIELFDSDNENSFSKAFNLINDVNNFQQMLFDLFKIEKNKCSTTEKLIILEAKKVTFEDFFTKISLAEAEDKLNKCFICNRKILVDEYIKGNQKDNKTKTLFFKCENCSLKETAQNNKAPRSKALENTLDIESLKTLKDKMNIKNNRTTNKFNFIEKLQLKDFYEENPGKSFFDKEKNSDSNNNSSLKLTFDSASNICINESSNLKSLEKGEFSFFDL